MQLLHIWLNRISKYEQNENLPINFFIKSYAIQYFSTLTAPVNYEIEVPVAPINPDEGCIIENSETTYQIFVIMGLVFASAYTLAALNMDRIGARLILCTNQIIIQPNWNNYEDFQGFDSIWCMFHLIFAATWIFVLTGFGFALLWAENFYLIQGLVIILLTCGNCASILLATFADLFPTRYKYVFFLMSSFVIILFNYYNLIQGDGYMYDCDIGENWGNGWK